MLRAAATFLLTTRAHLRLLQCPCAQMRCMAIEAIRTWEAEFQLPLGAIRTALVQSYGPARPPVAALHPNNPTGTRLATPVDPLELAGCRTGHAGGGGVSFYERAFTTATACCPAPTCPGPHPTCRCCAPGQNGRAFGRDCRITGFAIASEGVWIAPSAVSTRPLQHQQALRSSVPPWRLWRIRPITMPTCRVLPLP